MAIPKGKKRFFLTLDEKTMNRVQELSAALNLPRQTVSLIVDEFLQADLLPRLEDIYQKKTAGEQLSFGELFLGIGNSGSSIVTDGEHRGKLVEFHLDEIGEDGKLSMHPELKKENED